MKISEEIPKTLHKALQKYSYAVESAHKEDDGCGVKPYYWIYLKKEYICTEMECGTIHESTIQKCIWMLECIEKR